MIYAKKSLGQNFLIDQNIIKKILNLVDIKKQNIIEIGPENGALTDEILKKPKSLIIIEKDYLLSKKLKEKYLSHKLVKVINNDILLVDINKIIKKYNFNG